MLQSIRIGLLMLFALACLQVWAQEKTETFKVYGNCGMCKSRIEKAAKGDGVVAVSWDKDTKICTLTYDASKTTPDAVQKKIAAVGHDTDLFTAPNKVYDKLHGCCKYERKADTSGH